MEAPAGGHLLLALVGLSMTILLITALMGAAKQDGLLTEANFLTVSLILYGGATALYVAYAVTGTSRFVTFASLATWVGFAASTMAVAHRWAEAGRPPFANIYEMLLAFVWTLGALTLFVEKRYGVRVIGTVTLPLAVVSVLLMQVMPSGVHPLVPALQSVWLHIHVSLAMLSYAGCAISFALAMMFLVQDKMKTESFLAWTSGMIGAVYVGALATRFDPSGGLRVAAWDAAEGHQIFFAERTPLLVVIPSLGWLFLVVLLVVLAPLGLYLWSRTSERPEPVLDWANRMFFVGALLQIIACGVFLLRVKEGLYRSVQPTDVNNGLFPTHLSASPFLLAGAAGALFASLLYLMLSWRRSGLERMIPPSDTLDVLTYKTIGIAFPLLTLMIAAGAYWANQAWGSYWSWDPKETWALITWLVYAGYLHMRIARGWRGRRAAYFAIIGFAVVMFTFFGVTYLLPGMHAYA